MFATQRHKQAHSSFLHLEKDFGNYTPAGLSKAGRALMMGGSGGASMKNHLDINHDTLNFKLPSNHKLEKLKHVERTFKQSNELNILTLFRI